MDILQLIRPRTKSDTTKCLLVCLDAVAPLAVVAGISMFNHWAADVLLQDRRRDLGGIGRVPVR